MPCCMGCPIMPGCIPIMPGWCCIMGFIPVPLNICCWETYIPPENWNKNTLSIRCTFFAPLLRTLWNKCFHPPRQGIFFFWVPSYYLWGSSFWVRFSCMLFFLNPAIEVVTFRLHGWCMLGVFLFPAFTRPGHLLIRQMETSWRW